MSNSTQKWIILGSGIGLAGAALYYLSQDGGEVIRYDPVEHTVEKLRAIVHEVFVGSASHI